MSKMSQQSLPQSAYMNSLQNGPKMNTRQNIIAGPGPNQYWNHSPGAQVPIVQEEGPFPIQGNIGSLVAQEAIDYSLCSGGPDISSGPNCSGSFKDDIFTVSNTCGEECKLKYPESYGLKDFGFPKDMPSSEKITNAHQLHSYDNQRAGAPGQDCSMGPLEFIPRITDSGRDTGACIMNRDPVYNAVSDWSRLPMYENITYANFSKNL